MKTPPKKRKVDVKAIIEAKAAYTQEQAQKDVQDIIEKRRITAGGELHKALQKEVSNVYSYAGGNNTFAGNAVRVSLREDGSWLCVITAYIEAEGVDKVVFGSGDSVASALKNANAAIAKGAWRPVKKWGE